MISLDDKIGHLFKAVIRQISPGKFLQDQALGWKLSNFLDPINSRKIKFKPSEEKMSWKIGSGKSWAFLIIYNMVQALINIT